MAPNRIMPAPAMRRALRPLLAAALLALLVGGCGGGADPAISVPDREADAKVVEGVLGRQLGVVAAYDRVLPHLRGADLALAEKFRAQEQEHVDAMIKTLRGLGATDDAEPEAIEPGERKTRVDWLRFAYELESATIDDELSAIAKLSGGWPEALLATMAANQSQHLVLIRRALGARPLDTIPRAFEDGTTPAP